MAKRGKGRRRAIAEERSTGLSARVEALEDELRQLKTLVEELQGRVALRS